MIEVLSGFPSTVLAFAGKGEVTKEDYETVVIPMVDGALKLHHKIRLYYEIGDDVTGFEAGAIWDDFKVGVEHLTRWDRAAVVTDSEAIWFVVRAFAFMLPSGMRLFLTKEKDMARKWIKEDH